MEIKIVDGFVWAIPRTEQLQESFKTEEVFILHDDGGESLIQSYAEFDTSLHKGLTLGLEFAHEEPLRAEYEDALLRNNETRSFTAWLEDKAENLIY